MTFVQICMQLHLWYWYQNNGSALMCTAVFDVGLAFERLSCSKDLTAVMPEGFFANV